MVRLGYLKDDLEALKRATFYAKSLTDTTRSRELAKECDRIIATAASKLRQACDDFHGMFKDASEPQRGNPVNALKTLSEDPDNAKTIDTIFRRIKKTAEVIAAKTGAISKELGRLRATPGFKAHFPAYRRYIPAELPPVAVQGDGTLKRLIFAGPWAYTDTMVDLGFDTLTEECYAASPSQGEFTVREIPAMVKQWDKYKIPMSDLVLPYAVGDMMHCPPWFKDVYGNDPDYYFRPNYYRDGKFPSEGFDYRHPVPRQMITEFLEGAVRATGQKPYVFIYKGPWEAHPYCMASVSIPEKRTTAFQEHGFSKYAVKAFRNYLQEKFKTIAKLNESWRSSYESFDDIQPPEPLIAAFVITDDERGQDVYTPFLPVKRFPATPLTYEFERCRKDLYSDYLADCYQAIKRGDPKHPLASSTSGGIMNESLIRSIDDLQMAERCVDMWGKHASGGYGWDESPYQWGLNRYFNKTLVSLEYYGWAQEEIGEEFWPSQVLAPGATIDSVYNSGRRDIWHDFSWDRRMLLFYWGSKIVEIPKGFNRFTYPLARQWSSMFPVAKRRITNLNDIYFNVPIITPKIAVLHPGVSIINAYPTDGCRYAAKDIFDRLLARQYHFGVVPEKFVVSGRDSLDSYDVIVLPYVQYFDDAFARLLLAWVHRGGTLIAIGPFGLYDKYGFDAEDGAAQIFGDVEFTYPTPDEYDLSWAWRAEQHGKTLTDDFLTKQYGNGTVMLTLDGRALKRAGSVTAAAHIGTEIGAKVEGKTAGPEAKKRDDRARPLQRTADKDLPKAVQAFYDTLKNATRRKGWVTAGNVEMVIRNKDGDGPLYVSLLNWDYRQGIETEVVIRGEYNHITDLSIPDGFGVPATVHDGLTTLPVLLGPGEGLMLKLEP